MLETRTMLYSAILASRSASSNDASFSRCRPTPRVRKISSATNATSPASRLKSAWSPAVERGALGRGLGRGDGTACRAPRGDLALEERRLLALVLLEERRDAR